MSTTVQQRAVIEALELTPSDLRELAGSLERRRAAAFVREIAQAALAELPRHHLYVTSLRRLVRWAGDRDATSVLPRDIAAWAHRAAKEARTRPNARHGMGAHEAFVLAARAAWARAVDAGTVCENPAAEVHLPARPPSRRTALSCGQLKQAHLALVAHSRDPELDDLVFQFLRETACRRIGVVRLQASDLAPATRTAHLLEKYGKERWQPVSAYLMGRLLAHRRMRSCGCDQVFHRADGGHLNDRWFDGFGRRMRQVPWADELEISAHWLRHTTLTDIERLAGVRVAAAYAGHSDASFGVTGRYTKASPDELRVAHERLFFDNRSDAADPTALPHLFRRVVPSAAHPVEFTTE